MRIQARAGALIAWLLIAGCMAMTLGAATASAVDLPSGFQDSTVFEGVEEPTTFRFAPDGRVFVAEKPGVILVYSSLADTTPTVFADLRTKVYDRGDRGILGLALDPHFDSGRPYVYVLYTYDHVLGEAGAAPKWGEPNHTGDPCPEPNGADDCLVSGRLVRLTAEGDHAVGGASSASEAVLVEGWCQQFSSHSVGDLEFGPEDDLYASGGEGASFESADYGQFGNPVRNPCGDPPAGVGGEEKVPSAEGGSLRSQNPKLLSGKVIRIDPDTGQGVPGNPLYASGDENERRIAAEGFRNPFRFAIDPETDEVYVGNVGWGEIEEIDRFSGQPETLYNSGWPCYEGFAKNPGFAGLGLNVCENLYDHAGSTAPPFFSYEHDAGVTPDDHCPTEYGSAISGLDFYEGEGSPGEGFPASYQGALFFSDPIRQCLYVMFAGKDGRPDPATTIPFLTFGGVSPGIDIQEGPEGNLFYAKLFDEEFHGDRGSIHKIAYFSGNQPPVARLNVDHEWSSGNLTAKFDATESSDADGETLKYAWDPQGDGTYEAASPIGTKTLTFSDSKNHTVAVQVGDQQGATSVDRLTVYPHDTPPEPEILEPADPSTFRWRVGQAIHFAGAAADNEDGTLAATSLDWSSHLYHCPFAACHVHPLQAFPAVSAGTLIAPAHELPSHLELILSATDSRGLTATKAIALYPSEITLRIDSVPPGLLLSAGPLTTATPFDLATIEGSTLTLSAPATATLAGSTYAFGAWSDHEARVHSVEALAPKTYTAEYTSGESGEAPPASSAPVLHGPLPIGPPSPPATKIQAHPRSRVQSPTARFTFSSDEVGASFRCKLDGKKFRRCGSPLVYRHLRPGPHSVEIEAVGPTGLTDPSPAAFRWTVLCPRARAEFHRHCLP